MFSCTNFFDFIETAFLYFYSLSCLSLLLSVLCLAFFSHSLPFPSIPFLSPFFYLFFLFSLLLSSLLFSFCRFLTTGLCSVFHSDLKRCAEELVQSFAKQFPQPLDFLLKSPRQVVTELSPSWKISEDHILQWYDSRHETSVLICKSRSALLSSITGWDAVLFFSIAP